MRLSPVWALLVVSLLSLPVPAMAHAVLMATSPLNHSVAAAAPDEVALTFNEPVSALSVTLIAPDAARTDLTAATQSGATVRVPLPSGLSRGTHVLSWRVVSLDGHPIGGSLLFSIGSVTGSGEHAAATDSAVSFALWASRAVLYLALFVGVGGAVFGAVAPPLPVTVRRASGLSILLGLVVLPISLSMQGLDALGLPLGSVADPKVWSAALGTSYRLTGAVAFTALVLGGMALLAGNSFQWLAAVALAATALAPALSGHASAADPQWLTRPAVFLHVAGIVYWVGALLPLLLLLRDKGAQALMALGRFSATIPWAVAPVVASGVVLSVVQMGLPGPAWWNGYGLILSAKLGALAVLFGLAIWNRRSLTNPVLIGDGRAASRLRSSIRVELVLVVLILGLVAAWRLTTPPRALALAVAPPLEFMLHGELAMADVIVAPGRAGSVDVGIHLTSDGTASLPADDLTITLASPELGIEPFGYSATRGGNGVWHTTGHIPVPGNWKFTLDIRLSRFEATSLKGEVFIP